MVPFETTCVLWHPERPDGPVAGTLHFNREIGLSADLIGSLDPEEPIAAVFEPPTGEEMLGYADSSQNVQDGRAALDPGPIIPILLDVVPGHEITLLNVRRTEGDRSLPGPTHEVLSADVLVRGAALPEGFDTPIRWISIGLDVL